MTYMKRRNGKRIEVLLSAYAKGYRVSKDGELITPTGKPRAIQLINGGYPSFNYKYQGVNFHVFLHRLQAYQKFNWIMLIEGLLVRHDNNDKEDASYDNLLMGIHLDNYHDNSYETNEKWRQGKRDAKTEKELQDSFDEIGF